MKSSKNLCNNQKDFTTNQIFLIKNSKHNILANIVNLKLNSKAFRLANHFKSITHITTWETWRHLLRWRKRVMVFVLKIWKSISIFHKKSINIFTKSEKIYFSSHGDYLRVKNVSRTHLYSETYYK